ncbi:MAG: PHP domain-containing protein [Clostridiales bacterium]|jgi:DNA polymerase III alpha subunit|nr:PHP domain-containing protein [Clostridiales bacterium]
MYKDVNNHIHTTYSFSPYTPAAAVRKAKETGLQAAGIVDHDSISGADEFIAEGKRLGLPTTTGFEMRVYHAHTPIGRRRTNHPDQDDISYLTFHGVPHTRFEAVDSFLRPVRRARGERNRAICARLGLDYERDVLPLSMHEKGGSVTERHILFAKANGDYAELARLKSAFKDYIPAGRDECPDMEKALAFANANGIIATYPYLGDVTKSVTGDKKAQKFEDGYLDELIEILYNMGFRAISYMPSRNTREQLIRLRALCDKYGMLQISGEDINSPSQPFICEAMRDPMFANLNDTTWALIGHEQAATEDINNGFISLDGQLEEKIKYYKNRAKK